MWSVTTLTIGSSSHSDTPAAFVPASLTAGRSCTYAQLRTRSGHFASALIRCGVAPGDRVAVQVEKSVDAVLLYIACLRIRAVFVPINVLSAHPEVDHYLRDSQPCLAVVRPSDRASLEPLARAAGVPHLETLGAEGEGTLAELAARCVEYDPGQASQPPSTQLSQQNDLAAIIYTSGTTGRSKGAMLTRGNLALERHGVGASVALQRDDVVLHVLPLFHVHGLFVAVNTVLASTASLMLLPKFAARRVVTAPAAGFGVHGGADSLHAPAAGAGARS